MKNLLPGLRKFSEDVFPQLKPDFESLSQGQKPHTLLITCSDSRIDPNLVTQTQPGEIFVVRNAGNIIPPYGSSKGGEEAAIEFAVDGLRVTNLVICGHSHCGAMAALMGKVNLDGLPSVKSWLDHAQATRRRIDMLNKQKEIHLGDVTEENVLVQADNLKTHPAVSTALREQRIRIYGWVYQFEIGTISYLIPLSVLRTGSGERKRGKMISFFQLSNQFVPSFLKSGRFSKFTANLICNRISILRSEK